MKREVLIRLEGEQRYNDEQPDVIELTTEGTLVRKDGKLLLSYEETELTGLTGTTTTFELTEYCVRVCRNGETRSVMEFETGKQHKSLYHTPMGTLLMTVFTRRIENNMDERGGNLTVTYDINIEDLGMGQIEYRLTVTPL